MQRICSSNCPKRIKLSLHQSPLRDNISLKCPAPVKVCSSTDEERKEKPLLDNTTEDGLEVSVENCDGQVLSVCSSPSSNSDTSVDYPDFDERIRRLDEVYIPWITRLEQVVDRAKLLREFDVTSFNNIKRIRSLEDVNQDEVPSFSSSEISSSSLSDNSGYNGSISNSSDTSTSQHSPDPRQEDLIPRNYVEVRESYSTSTGSSYDSFDDSSSGSGYWTYVSNNNNIDNLSNPSIDPWQEHDYAEYPNSTSDYSSIGLYPSAECSDENKAESHDIEVDENIIRQRYLEYLEALDKDGCEYPSDDEYVNDNYDSCSNDSDGGNDAEKFAEDGEGIERAPQNRV